jgi:hypothetical protein
MTALSRALRALRASGARVTREDREPTTPNEHAEPRRKPEDAWLDEMLREDDRWAHVYGREPGDRPRKRGER